MMNETDVISSEKQSLYEQMPMAICVFHFNQGELSLKVVSDGMCRMIELTREEILDDFKSDRYMFILQDELSKIIELDSENQEFHGRHRLKKNLSSFIWTDYRGRVKKLEDDSYLIFIYYLDITSQEEQRLELEAEHLNSSSLLNKIDELNNELEAKVNEYDMLMRSTGVCITKVLLDNEYSIIWNNDNLFKVIKCKRKDFHKLYDFKLKRYLETDKEQLDMFENTVKNALKDNKSSFEFIMRLSIRHGYIWIKGTGTFTDYLGTEPSSLYLVFTDVSRIIANQERLNVVEKQVEKANKISEENASLMGIINNVSSGIGLNKLLDGRFTGLNVNHYFTEMLGYTNKDIANSNEQRLADFVHPDDFERFMKSSNEFYAKDLQGDLGTYRILKKNTDQYIWINIKGRKINKENGNADFYIAYTDVDRIKRIEQQLIKNTKIYEEAIDAADLTVWEYDIADSRIKFLEDSKNIMNATNLGWNSIIENVPESLVDEVDENSVPAFMKMYESVKQGNNASCDAWYKAVSGREARCIRISYSVEKGPNGKPVTAYGISVNITAQKKVEERYEREQQFLKETGESNLVAKGHFNLTKNEVIEYTQNNKAILDITPDMSYDSVFDMFANLDYLYDTEQDVKKILVRSYLIKRYQLGEMHHSLVYCRENSDHSQIWISMIIHVYMMPVTSDVECFIYGYDVTESVLENKIITKLTQLDYDEIGMINAISGLCRIYRINKYDHEISETKNNYDEGLVSNLKKTVPQDQFDSLSQNLLLKTVINKLDTKVIYTYSMEMQFEGRSCQKRFLYSYLDDKHHDIFFSMSDITEQYQKEHEQIQQLKAANLEAENANEAKSTFLSSMSHDIRTPLNGIIGFADLAYQEHDQVTKQQYIDKIRISSELLLDLVNDTLELSRIESGKQVIENEKIDARILVRNIMVTLRPMADEKGIKLILDKEKFPDKLLWSDKLKLQKIFLNLLTNAIKYTPKGGTVWITAEVLDPPIDGFNNRIIVKDNGIGMSEEFMTRLFEPFAQEHRKEAKNVFGTGLGLSIVKRTVDFMGGRISVKSKIDQGTTFTVDLPVKYLDDEYIVQLEAENVACDLSNKKILVIEDNKINAEIVSIMLKERKIEVDLAKDGKQGLDLFKASKNGHYDMILTDIRMPLMDGYEVTKAIRELDRSDAKQIPIIVMTADVFDATIRQCLKTGMNDYIGKPINAARMFSVIEKWMK